MQAVYSYGGAMLFLEFMSEMKRPFDFWKGMICAQTFIYFCYMLFGLFVYSYQGQFTIVGNSFPRHYFLICGTLRVARLVAEVDHARILFHDSVFIRKQTR